MTTLPENVIDIRTVEVERILPGGVGLARIGGRSVLLEGTAPGDVVEVDIGVRRPALLRIVAPSRDRVVPVCQDVERCGGCDLMHLAYPAQLKAKIGMLEDCLRRIGKLASWPAIQLIDSPEELGYRLRASFHVAGDGSLGYRARRSHDIVSIRRCHVLHPALEAWRMGFDALGSPVGERVSAMTDGTTISTTTIGAAEALSVSVGRERYLAAADSFFQANGTLVERMVAEVVRLAAPTMSGSVLDLYAGAGLFSIPLARLATSVIAVESDRRAVELLRRCLVEAGVTNVAVRQERVEQAMRHGPEIGPEVVVLDPPRAGAGDEVVRRVAASKPARIVMVSCDPATFARDVKAFREDGYALRELLVLDMFPQTHHLEVVSLLVPA